MFDNNSNIGQFQAHQGKDDRNSIKIQDDKLNSIKIQDEQVKSVRIQDEKTNSIRLQDEQVKSVGIPDVITSINGIETDFKSVRLQDEQVRSVKLQDEQVRSVRLQDGQERSMAIKQSRQIPMDVLSQKDFGYDGIILRDSVGVLEATNIDADNGDGVIEVDNIYSLSSDDKVVVSTPVGTTAIPNVPVVSFSRKYSFENPGTTASVIPSSTSINYGKEIYAFPFIAKIKKAPGGGGSHYVEGVSGLRAGENISTPPVDDIGTPTSSVSPIYSFYQHTNTGTGGRQLKFGNDEYTFDWTKGGGGIKYAGGGHKGPKIKIFFKAPGTNNAYNIRYSMYTVAKKKKTPSDWDNIYVHGTAKITDDEQELLIEAANSERFNHLLGKDPSAYSAQFITGMIGADPVFDITLSEVAKTSDTYPSQASNTLIAGTYDRKAWEDGAWNGSGWRNNVYIYPNKTIKDGNIGSAFEFIDRIDVVQYHEEEGWRTRTIYLTDGCDVQGFSGNVLELTDNEIIDESVNSTVIEMVKGQTITYDIVPLHTYINTDNASYVEALFKPTGTNVEYLIRQEVATWHYEYTELFSKRDVSLCVIKTYQEDSNEEVISGTIKYILGFKKDSVLHIPRNPITLGYYDLEDKKTIFSKVYSIDSINDKLADMAVVVRVKTDKSVNSYMMTIAEAKKYKYGVLLNNDDMITTCMLIGDNRDDSRTLGDSSPTESTRGTLSIYSYNDVLYERIISGIPVGLKTVGYPCSMISTVGVTDCIAELFMTIGYAAESNILPLKFGTAYCDYRSVAWAANAVTESYTHVINTGIGLFWISNIIQAVDADGGFLNLPPRMRDQFIEISEGYEIGDRSFPLGKSSLVASGGSVYESGNFAMVRGSSKSLLNSNGDYYYVAGTLFSSTDVKTDLYTFTELGFIKSGIIEENLLCTPVKTSDGMYCLTKNGIWQLGKEGFRKISRFDSDRGSMKTKFNAVDILTTNDEGGEITYALTSNEKAKSVSSCKFNTYTEIPKTGNDGEIFYNTTINTFYIWTYIDNLVKKNGILGKYENPITGEKSLPAVPYPDDKAFVTKHNNGLWLEGVVQYIGGYKINMPDGLYILTDITSAYTKTIPWRQGLNEFPKDHLLYVDYNGRITVNIIPSEGPPTSDAYTIITTRYWKYLGPKYYYTGFQGVKALPISSFPSTTYDSQRMLLRTIGQNGLLSKQSFDMIINGDMLSSDYADETIVLNIGDNGYDIKKLSMSQELNQNGSLVSSGMFTMEGDLSDNYVTGMRLYCKGTGYLYLSVGDKNYTIAVNSLRFSPVDTFFDGELLLDDFSYSIQFGNEIKILNKAYGFIRRENLL